MSKLIAWFPLHKDQQDWSGNGNHLSQEGAGIVGDKGVLGNCYQTNGLNSTSRLKSPPLDLGGDHAMFCFVKVKQLATTDSANGVITNHDHTKSLGTGISLRARDGGFSASVNTGHKTSRSYKDYYGSTILKVNEWHHIGFTWEQVTRTLKIYVNGKIDFESVGSIPAMEFDRSYPLALFAWSLGYLGSGSYRPNLSLQDVRVYKGIPSLYEIDQFSKGCIFNWNFNQQTYGSKVGITDWDVYSSYSTKLASSSNYIKAKMKTDGWLAIRPVGYSPYNRKVRISGFAFKNGSPIEVTNITSYGSAERVQFSDPVSGWFIYEGESGSSHVIHHNAGIANPKVDDIYEFKQLIMEDVVDETGNSGFIGDLSGLNNHGVADKDLPVYCKRESNLGNGAYYFDNDAILSSQPLNIGGGNQITLAAWVKSSSVGYDDWQTLITCSSTDCEIKINPTGRVRTGFLVDGVRQYVDVSADLLDGKWHHVASTYDGSVIKVYKDGQLIGSKSISGNMNITQAKVTLGQQTIPKGKYSAKELYMSSAMMFGRALSETDIENLFRQRLTVSKSGEFYARKFVEKPSATHVTRKGELVTNQLLENNYKPSNIDYSSWVIGQSDAPYFLRNGASNENLISTAPNPHGITDVVWETIAANTTPDADGGFNSSLFNIDNTKLYRFSCWFNRKVMGNGRYYFGVHSYDNNGEHSLETLAGEVNNNPYFKVGDAFAEDTWFLVVGYVCPQGSTTSDIPSDAGVYLASGEKVTGVTTFRWGANAAKSNIRSYLFYSSSTATKQYFYRPRVDLADGSEPSLQQLIKCSEHIPLINFYGSNGAYKVNKSGFGVNVVAKELKEI